jgi:cytochrome c oxidase subunit II
VEYPEASSGLDRLDGMPRACVQLGVRSEGGVSLKSLVIGLLLAVCAIGAGGWARQGNGSSGVEDVTTIDVVASRFQFDPQTITVAEGDRVRLRVRSADRTHGLAIKAFGVNTLIPTTAEPIVVEFVADKAGAFDMTCSEYCGTRHAEMRGRLVVLAKHK